MKTLKKKPVQIYIEYKQEQSLESLARRKGVSKAEIIRQSIDYYLQTLPVQEDPALGIMGIGRSGKADLSEHHDAYLSKFSAFKHGKVASSDNPSGGKKKR